MLRYIRELKASVNLFSVDKEYRFFRQTLDAEMKRLRRDGIGAKHKTAEPISVSEEERLWSTGLLGDSSPQILLDTMVFLCGMYFVLRSGQEHRVLTIDQLDIVEPATEGRAHVVYTENVAKNNTGGLPQRKLKAKQVVHHANSD